MKFIVGFLFIVLFKLSLSQSILYNSIELVDTGGQPYSTIQSYTWITMQDSLIIVSSYEHNALLYLTPESTFNRNPVRIFKLSGEIDMELSNDSIPYLLYRFACFNVEYPLNEYIIFTTVDKNFVMFMSTYGGIVFVKRKYISKK